MARVVGRAALSVVGRVFLLVGLALLVVSAVLGGLRWSSLRSRARADGTVVALRSHGRGKHPVIEFAPAGGQVVQIESAVGSNPPAFAVGDRVAVLYDSTDPKQAEIDRFWALWFFPTLAGILGTAFTLLGGILSLAGRRSIVALIILGVATPSRADQVRHPAGFAFKLPDIGDGWEQDRRSDFITINDPSDKLPELHVFLFPAQGGLDELKRDLEKEVSNWEKFILKTFVDVERVTPFKVLDAKPERIADAQALLGHATMGGAKVGFAIVQRKGRSLILVGVPKDGIYERGMRTFTIIVRGLQPQAISRDVLPNMPEMVGVRDVTATSTYDDERNHYDVRRTVAYDTIPDKTPGHENEFVPRTGWCEGKPDEGIGETVTITLAQPTELHGLRIAAGVWRTQKLFESNNRIASLDVLLDGKKITVAPPAKREWTSLAFHATVSTITIRVAAVKRGKMNDSCLTAIELVRDGETLTPLMGVDGAAVDKLPKALVKMQAEHVQSVDPMDDRAAGIDGSKPGIVEVTFPSHSERVNVWRLQWQGGAWRLLGIVDR